MAKLNYHYLWLDAQESGLLQPQAELDKNRLEVR